MALIVANDDDVTADVIRTPPLAASTVLVEKASTWTIRSRRDVMSSPLAI